MNEFDTTLRPQDDYFGYVNNNWLQQNPIPATESAWGTFYVLRDQAVQAVRAILDDLTDTSEDSLSHDQKLLRSVYASALAFDKDADAHRRWLERSLAQIDAIESHAQLAAYLGQAHRSGYSHFWTAYVGLDDKDSSAQALRLYQSGLSLPNRDYYLENTPDMRSIRTKYAAFYEKALPLAATPERAAWDQVKQVETALATAAWTDVELRDVQKNYAKVPLQTLSERLGEFDWEAYFDGLGWHSPSDHFVIDQFSYIERCIGLMHELPLTAIKAYLHWGVVNAALAWFSKAASALNFDFYGRTISGMQEQKPLWKRASLLMDTLIIGELVGREYAARHFPETSKQQVLGLVEDVRRAYHGRIERLEWMSDTTKRRAHTKLDNLKVFIGYPNVWKDFSALSAKQRPLLETVEALNAFETELELAQVGTQPAAEDWEMNAHTVNAYHHPNRLEIVFPAAILQPPFFDPAASVAANLGGIGAVIGHELTHGFDDQGSEFDEFGNSNPWQTEKEREAFFARAENIVELADHFETVPGTFLQGKLILGEAIADIGGLQLAVKALEQKLSGDTDRRESALKELFVTFARAECGHATKERLVQLAKIDPHPPSPFRVNCVVSHVEAFYETYGLAAGDKLYLPPEKRAHIW